MNFKFLQAVEQLQNIKGRPVCRIEIEKYLGVTAKETSVIIQALSEARLLKEDRLLLIRKKHMIRPLKVLWRDEKSPNFFCKHVNRYTRVY